MKFILIYGSPAAGKLTVANEVAVLTGFKVFHNHLTINCVQPIFDYGTAPFGRLVESFRLQLIAEAAREGVDLIHTFVYAKGHDDPYIQKITAAVEENGGRVCPVLLRCDFQELARRVTAQSRAAAGKVATQDLLRSLHENYDLGSTVPRHESIVIDNTSLPARRAAEQIVEHYRLGPPGMVGSLNF